MKTYRAHTPAGLAILALLGCLPGAAALAVAQATGGSPAAGPPQIVPAATLTAPTTPSAMPDAEGFIRRWLILEPVTVEGQTQNIVRDAVKKYAFPGSETAIPRNGESVSLGGKDLAWHALDTKYYNINLFHFARSLGKPTSNVLFWAEVVVNSPVERKDVRLAVGSNAASVWFVNGEELVGIYGDRQTVIDDGVSKRVTLKKGQNILRAAVVNGSGATDFCARFLDENDKPLKGYTLTVSK
ncbi:hypothetical protein [Terriglobus sp. RCC_193]|uniref:hypothetical protein n=1 Tax=Terriglobus sp. RCC_193 TaxID=3239218 RepID=UPI003523B891